MIDVDSHVALKLAFLRFLRSLVGRPATQPQRKTHKPSQFLPSGHFADDNRRKPLTQTSVGN